MELKEYLGQIKKLEVLAYEQEYICKNVEYSLKRLQSLLEKTKIETKVELVPTITKKQIIAILCTIIVIGALIVGFVIVGGGATTEVWVSLGIYFVIVMVFIVLIDCKNHKKDEKNGKICEMNEAIDEHNRRAQVTRARIEKKRLHLKRQRDTVIINRQQTQNALKRLYSKDLIHPKYRNLIAICSMYEYFDTGRCTTLTGHEGAYNIFENEIRLNLIINKMEIVIKNLEQLRENQYELYCVMSESNRKLNYINNNLNNISSVTNDIAESAALTEYNSRIAAQNTEVLKWIEIFEHM